MVNRRHFIGALTGTCLLTQGVAPAQAPAKVWRIGVLGNNRPISPVFVEALNQFGYRDGTTAVFEQRFTDGRDDRAPALIAELVALNVDVLVVSGPAAIAAKAATTKIPIVMAGVSDPVGRGLVPSLAHPGGNLTGIANMHLDLNVKRIEVLRQAVPKLARLVTVGNWEPTVAGTLDKQDAEAGAMGIAVRRLELNAPGDFDKVAAAIVRDPPDALMLLPVALTWRLRKEFADLALARRLPTMGWHREQALAGILMTYATSNDGISRDAAVYVNKILKGARPGDLPIEQPTAVELIINQRTARALDLTVPQSLLIRADELIG